MLNISKKQVYDEIWVIRKKMTLISQSTTTPNTTSTSENSSNLEASTPTTTQILEIEVKENDGLSIFVKTCKAYEDYLKANKQVRTSVNYFNTLAEGQFYHLSLIDNYLDDINKPVIYEGKLNFAILRVPGISEGREFKIKGLMTEQMLQTALTNLSNVFNKFYEDNILKKKINIKLEVVKNDI